MPSSLSLKKLPEKVIKEEDQEPIAQPNEVKAGKLGKLEVRQSGRVFLVTENGDRYECHAGTAAFFSQYVASLTIKDAQQSGSSSNSSSSSSSSSRKKRVNDGAADDALHLLGPITRKWVVTGPSH